VKLCGHKVLNEDKCRDYIIEKCLTDGLIKAQQGYIEVLEALLSLEQLGVVEKVEGPPTEVDLEEHREGLKWLRSL